MAEGLRERFLRIYSNLPINLRKEIILIMQESEHTNKNEKPKEIPITWDVAYLEITNKTALGEKILKKLDELKIL